MLLDGSKEGSNNVSTQPLATKPDLLNRFKFLYSDKAKADEYYTDVTDANTGYKKPSPALAG